MLSSFALTLMYLDLEFVVITLRTIFWVICSLLMGYCNWVWGSLESPKHSLKFEETLNCT